MKEMPVLKLPCASLLWISLMIAACGARSAGPPAAPKASTAALAARPIDWARRDPAAPVVPASVTHLQLIITPAWAKGEHFAWLVSSGTEVVVVYHCTTAEIGAIIDVSRRAFVPTEGSPLDKTSYGVLGSFNPPPPPPPDPGGFPGPYVESVLHAAWSMNYEAEALEAQAGK
jgi:hypothetical protein